VGLELEKKKNGEKTVLEMKSLSLPTGKPGGVKDSPESLKGEPEQGRPRNSKDTSQRKQKQFSPQTGAKLQVWSDSAQDTISELLNPILLDFYNKKNMRSLSSEQYLESEETKTKLLLSAKPFSEINDNYLNNNLSLINNNNINKIYNSYINFLNSMKYTMARELTVQELKCLKSYLYSMVYDNIT